MKPTTSRPIQAALMDQVLPFLYVMLYTLRRREGRAGQAHPCVSFSTCHEPSAPRNPAGKPHVSLRVLLHIPKGLTLPSLPRGRSYLVHNLPWVQNGCKTPARAGQEGLNPTPSATNRGRSALTAQSSPSSIPCSGDWDEPEITSHVRRASDILADVNILSEHRNSSSAWHPLPAPESGEKNAAITQSGVGKEKVASLLPRCITPRHLPSAPVSN